MKSLFFNELMKKHLNSKTYNLICMKKRKRAHVHIYKQFQHERFTIVLGIVRYVNDRQTSVYHNMSRKQTYKNNITECSKTKKNDDFSATI